jgi:hypothetical protein
MDKSSRITTTPWSILMKTSISKTSTTIMVKMICKTSKANNKWSTLHIKSIKRIKVNQVSMKKIRRKSNKNLVKMNKRMPSLVFPYKREKSMKDKDNWTNSSQITNNNKQTKLENSNKRNQSLNNSLMMMVLSHGQIRSSLTKWGSSVKNHLDVWKSKILTFWSHLRLSTSILREC